MDAAEQIAWNPSEYAWDPHRLVVVPNDQQSSAVSLHAAVAATGTEPQSLVTPVLGFGAANNRHAPPGATCKVEGCLRQLQDEKPYYQRFMVCEDHMRCLSITVDGILSRFCQQCAKFEPVEAFDGSRRSCRERLQEHNKRRRKTGSATRVLRRHRRNASSSKASRAEAAETAADTPVTQAAAGLSGAGAIQGSCSPVAAAAVVETAPSVSGSTGPVAVDTAGVIQCSSGLQRKLSCISTCSTGSGRDAAADVPGQHETAAGTWPTAAGQPAEGCTHDSKPGLAAEATCAATALADKQAHQSQQHTCMQRSHANDHHMTAEPSCSPNPRAGNAQQQQDNMHETSIATCSSPVVTRLLDHSGVGAVAMCQSQADFIVAEAAMDIDSTATEDQALAQLPAAGTTAAVVEQPPDQAGSTTAMKLGLNQQQHDKECVDHAAQPQHHQQDQQQSGAADVLLDQLLAEVGSLVPGLPASLVHPPLLLQQHQQQQQLSRSQNVAPGCQDAVALSSIYPHHRSSLGTDIDDSAEGFRYSEPSLGSGKGPVGKLELSAAAEAHCNKSLAHLASSQEQLQCAKALQEAAMHDNALHENAMHDSKDVCAWVPLQLQQQQQQDVRQQQHQQDLQEQQQQLLALQQMQLGCVTQDVVNAQLTAVGHDGCIADDQYSKVWDYTANADLDEAHIDQQLQQLIQEAQLQMLVPTTSTPAAAASAAAAVSEEAAGTYPAAAPAPAGAAHMAGLNAVSQAMYWAAAVGSYPSSGSSSGMSAASAAAWLGVDGYPQSFGPIGQSIHASQQQPAGIWQQQQQQQGWLDVPGQCHSWMQMTAEVGQSQQQQNPSEAAMRIAQGGSSSATYGPSADTSLRLSLKLHNATPNQLNPNLLPSLNTMLAAAGTAVETGYMRPGCVHLTLQLRAQTNPVNALVQQRVASSTGAAAAAADGCPDPAAAAAGECASAAVAATAGASGSSTPAAAAAVSRVAGSPEAAAPAEAAAGECAGAAVAAAAAVSRVAGSPEAAAAAEAAAGECAGAAVAAAAAVSRVAGSPEAAAPAEAAAGECAGAAVAAAAAVSRVAGSPEAAAAAEAAAGECAGAAVAAAAGECSAGASDSKTVAAAGAAAAVSRVLADVSPKTWATALLPGAGSSSNSSSQQQPLLLTAQLPDGQVISNCHDSHTGNATYAAAAAAAAANFNSSSMSSSNPAQDDLHQQQPLLQRPQLRSVLPCVLNSSKGPTDTASLVAIGSNLTASECKPFARSQGLFLPTVATPLAHKQAQNGITQPHIEHIRLDISRLPRQGLVYVEFQQGSVLSEARPVLVVTRNDVVTELRGLTKQVLAGGAQQLEAEWVLVDFGRLLDFQVVAEAHDDSSSSVSDQQQQQQHEVDKSLSESRGNPSSNSGSSNSGSSRSSVGERQQQQQQQQEEVDQPLSESTGENPGSCCSSGSIGGGTQANLAAATAAVPAGTSRTAAPSSNSSRINSSNSSSSSVGQQQQQQKEVDKSLSESRCNPSSSSRLNVTQASPAAVTAAVPTGMSRTAAPSSNSSSSGSLHLRQADLVAAAAKCNSGGSGSASADMQRTPETGSSSSSGASADMQRTPETGSSSSSGAKADMQRTPETGSSSSSGAKADMQRTPESGSSSSSSGAKADMQRTPEPGSSSSSGAKADMQRTPETGSSSGSSSSGGSSPGTKRSFLKRLALSSKHELHDRTTSIVTSSSSSSSSTGSSGRSSSKLSAATKRLKDNLGHLVSRSKTFNFGHQGRCSTLRTENSQSSSQSCSQQSTGNSAVNFGTAADVAKTQRRAISLDLGRRNKPYAGMHGSSAAGSSSSSSCCNSHGSSFASSGSSGSSRSVKLEQVEHQLNRVEQRILHHQQHQQQQQQHEKPQQEHEQPQQQHQQPQQQHQQPQQQEEQQKEDQQKLDSDQQCHPPAAEPNGSSSSETDCGSSSEAESADEQQQQQQQHKAGADLRPVLIKPHPFLTLDYKATMIAIGIRLLRYFLDKGSPACCQLVLDIVLTHAAPVASFAAIAAAIEENNKLTMLHRAVRSGSIPTVTTVLSWGTQHSYKMRWDAAGPLGLSPLHLAALIAGSSSSRGLAAVILRSRPSLATLWFGLKANDGSTPAMYASKLGLGDLNRLVHGLLVDWQQQQQQRGGAAGLSVDIQKGMKGLQQQQQGDSGFVAKSSLRSSSSSSRGAGLGPGVAVTVAADSTAAAAAAAAAENFAAALSSNRITSSSQLTSTDPSSADPIVATQSSQYNHQTEHGPSTTDHLVSSSSSSSNTALLSCVADLAASALADCLNTISYHVAHSPQSLRSNIYLVLILVQALFVLLLVTAALRASAWALATAAFGIWGMSSVRQLLKTLDAMAFSSSNSSRKVQVKQPLKQIDGHMVKQKVQQIVSNAVRPMSVGYNKWMLVFDDHDLEAKYCKVLADTRGHADAAAATAIKALIVLLPLLSRIASSSSSSSASLRQHQQHWSLTPGYQLAGVTACSLPLIGALLSPTRYYLIRDSLLALTQALLLLMLRQQLLPSAAAAECAPWFSGMAGALLLLLFRQRFCWAVWQAAFAVAACATLLITPGVETATAAARASSSGSVGWWWLDPGSWMLLLLLPASVLLLIYIRERIDRSMFLAARHNSKLQRLKQA